MKYLELIKERGIQGKIAKIEKVSVQSIYSATANIKRYSKISDRLKVSLTRWLNAHLKENYTEEELFEDKSS